MTMRPEISISLRASRMRSTAAPSAMLRSPRPIQREALRAASSVTRTKSSESIGLDETKRGIVVATLYPFLLLEPPCGNSGPPMLEQAPSPAYTRCVAEGEVLHDTNSPSVASRLAIAPNLGAAGV